MDSGEYCLIWALPAKGKHVMSEFQLMRISRALFWIVKPTGRIEVGVLAVTVEDAAEVVVNKTKI